MDTDKAASAAKRKQARHEAAGPDAAAPALPTGGSPGKGRKVMASQTMVTAASAATAPAAAAPAAAAPAAAAPAPAMTFEQMRFMCQQQAFAQAAADYKAAIGTDREAAFKVLHDTAHRNLEAAQQLQLQLLLQQQHAGGVAVVPFWTFDEEATAYAQELMACELVDLGEGVQVLRMTRGLQRSEKESPQIFLRAQVRDVWARAHELITDPAYHYHVIVTGSPGVGKSRTLLLLLRQLLREHKKIIFESPKDEAFYRFTPPNAAAPDGQYEVHKVENIRASYIDELRDPTVFYLIDPDKKYETTSAKNAHTVLAVSPNSSHYRNLVDNEHVMTLYVTTATLEELQVMRPFLSDLEEDQLKQRFYGVGGILRNIFASKIKYDNAMAKMRSHVGTTRLVVLNSLQEGHIRRLDERYPYLPSSAVCAIECTEAPYDGTKVKVVFVSELAAELFGVRWAKMLNFASLPALFGNVKGHIFERVALERLAEGGDFNMVDLETPGPKREIIPLYIKPMPLHKVEQLTWAEAKSQLLVPSARNEAFKDALCPLGALQMTVSPAHLLNRRGAKALLDQPGAPDRLPVYMVVPTDVFRKWRNNLAPKLGPSPAQEDDEDFLKKLHRYALCIPDPELSEQAIAAFLEQH